MREEINKACEYLIKQSFPAYDKKTCGQCASKVANAWDFAFGKKVKRFPSAKDCEPTYLDLGFEKVFSYPEQNKEEYKPEIGDVSIIQYEPYGHIAVRCDWEEKVTDPVTKKTSIITRRDWISDFKQSNGGSKLPLASMYGGKIRDKNPPFTIYRLS